MSTGLEAITSSGKLSSRSEEASIAMPANLFRSLGMMKLT